MAVIDLLLPAEKQTRVVSLHSETLNNLLSLSCWFFVLRRLALLHLLLRSQTGDLEANAKILCAIVDCCVAKEDWTLLNEQVSFLSKKRALIKQVI